MLYCESGASFIDTFTKRLKESRLRRGLSQRQLGIEAGIDASVASPRVNQYETGKHRPDTNMVHQLCKVLEIPVAYLYADDDELALILLKFGQLDKATKKQVLELFQHNE